LAIAIIVPVAVVGWAILFSVEAGRRGPAWAAAHLRVVAIVMGVLLLVSLAGVAAIRPAWLGLAAAYPLGLGALLARGRWRQLHLIEREIGFGDIDPRIRQRVLERLRKGLALTGVLALVAGLALLAVGIPHGLIVIVLVPIAIVAVLRSRSSVTNEPGPAPNPS
jgi:hypothetical protein